MSRRYASSKFRIVLLCSLLAACILVSTTYGQTDSGAAPKRPPAGLGQLILSNVDFVFITIMLLSIIGLTLIIQGFIQNRASVFMPEASTQHIRELIGQRKFKELIEYTETDPSFVSRSLNPALKRAPSFSSMKEAMETAIGEQTAEQFRKIEYLNIIGNLGPLLGLLGTVLGMIEAFQQMQGAGGADPGKLGYGIATALSHTFMGLMLAVPCLAAFGVLRTMVDRLTVQGALEAEDILLMIKPVEPRPVATAPRPGGLPQPAVGNPPLRKGPLPTPAPMPAPSPE